MLPMKSAVGQESISWQQGGELKGGADRFQAENFWKSAVPLSKLEFAVQNVAQTTQNCVGMRERSLIISLKIVYARENRRAYLCLQLVHKEVGNQHLTSHDVPHIAQCVILYGCMVFYTYTYTWTWTNIEYLAHKLCSVPVAASPLST